MTQAPKTIAFQGALGAYSDIACRSMFPALTTLPCATFEDAFRAVQDSSADLGMIPIDNTLAGRVADVHHLLPHSSLHIIGEHFEPIRHTLLGVKGAKLGDIKDVYSHIHAIPQCRNVIRELGLKAHVHGDTASSAKDVADWNDKTKAAIASSLAGEIYGLDILKDNIQDEDHNTTRFLVLSREDKRPAVNPGKIMTSFFFEVRDIPAALYKGLGGFATNGVQMTKLESYVAENFGVARFFAEVIGHPSERPLGLALEELAFFAKDIKIMGVYPGHPFRFGGKQATSSAA